MRAYQLYLLGVYYSPHKLNVSVAYDYNPSPTQTSVIIPKNYAAPWGGEQLWGSGSAWGGPGNIEQWRVFLAHQKCESLQISVTETYDASIGAAAGAGFTLSGMNLVVGMKSGYPRLWPQSRWASVDVVVFNGEHLTEIESSLQAAIWKRAMPLAPTSWLHCARHCCWLSGYA